jgi:hypothetical protein
VVDTRPNSTLWGFFSWRDVAPGTALTIQVRWDGEVAFTGPLTVSRVQGGGRLIVAQFPPLNECSMYIPAQEVMLILSSAGRELSRGAVRTTEVRSGDCSDLR